MQKKNKSKIRILESIGLQMNWCVYSIESWRPIEVATEVSVGQKQQLCLWKKTGCAGRNTWPQTAGIFSNTKSDYV